MAVSIGELEATLRLRDEMSAQLSAIAGQLSSFAGGVGQAVLKANLVERAVRGVVDFAQDAVFAASQIHDLSQKTGLSVEAIQIYGQAAELSGSNVEQFANAVFRLGVNIEKGTPQVKAAVEGLGLSLQELQAMTPDQLFDTIAAKLAVMEDVTKRNQLGVLLFGQTWGQVAPAISQGMDKIAADTIISSEAQIAALDRMIDRWDLWIGNLSSGIRQQLGQFFLDAEAAISGFGKLFDDAGMKLDGLTLGVSNMVTGVTDFIGNLWVITRDNLIKVGDLFVAFRDKAIAAMKGLYEGAKTWLIDSFVGIVNGARDKINAVTGFFADMYDKVVGNSYVPDMVNIIGQQFARLTGLMETPARGATSIVTSLFGGMFQSITAKFSEWGGSVGGLVTNLIGGPLGSAFGKLAGGLVASISGIISGGIGTLLSMALPFAIEGLKKLGDVIWNGLKTIGGWIKGLFTGGADQHEAPDIPSGGGPDPSNPNNPYVNPETGAPYDPGNPDDPNAPDPNVPPGTSMPDWSHLPGYAKGGYIEAGSGTPAMLHGNEWIIPDAMMGRAGGGGVNVVVSPIFNINAIDSADVLEWMRRGAATAVAEGVAAELIRYLDREQLSK